MGELVGQGLAAFIPVQHVTAADGPHSEAGQRHHHHAFSADENAGTGRRAAGFHVIIELLEKEDLVFVIHGFAAIDPQRQRPAVKVSGLEHDRETLDHGFGEPDIADVAVIGALVNEAFFLRVLLHRVDLRIFATLDALGPREVEIQPLAGLLGTGQAAEFLDVFAVGQRELRERVGGLAAILEFENDSFVFNPQEGRLDLPILDIGP